MKVTIASVAAGQARAKNKETDTLFDDYVKRSGRYLTCDAAVFETEALLLAWLERSAGRVPAYAILLDSHGQMITSEEFAAMLGRLRDESMQRVVLAIGPADGWSATAKKRAQATVSLGRITLPHQLARVIAAEQVYRALTILAGHPYHGGH